MGKKTKKDVLVECNKAILKEIAKEYQQEALDIMRLTTDDIREEFLDYHKKDKGNICCLVLDKAKQKLIAEGKMKHKDDDAFGKPFML